MLEQPSGSLLASSEVSRHCPRTPLSRSIAMAPISQISDQPPGLSILRPRKCFPVIHFLSMDLLTALPVFWAETAPSSSSDHWGLLHWIDDGPLQRESTTPMLQLGTLQLSFGDRCNEDTLYWMEAHRCCTLFLEFCHAQNARLQRQQIASRVVLIDCSNSDEHHSQYGTQHMDALVR